MAPAVGNGKYYRTSRGTVPDLCPVLWHPRLAGRLERRHLREKSVPRRKSHQPARGDQRDYPRHQRVCRCVGGPGDVVILPDMMWGNYNMILNVRKHATITHFKIFTESGGYNTDAFAAKVKEEAAQRDKIIVLLNFPQNPTGYTLTVEEADRIVQVLTEVAQAGTNVIAVADDAYFGLFFEDNVLKESVFARLAGAHPRLLAVKLDGATKENYVWGLRVGFITYGCSAEKDLEAVYDAMVRKTAGAVRGNISNASHLSQSIVLASMKSEAFAAEKAEKYKILEARAKKVKKVLADLKYKDVWDVYPFNSGYFMCIRLKTVNAEKPAGPSAGQIRCGADCPGADRPAGGILLP